MWTNYAHLFILLFVGTQLARLGLRRRWWRRQQWHTEAWWHAASNPWWHNHRRLCTDITLGFLHQRPKMWIGYAVQCSYILKLNKLCCESTTNPIPVLRIAASRGFSELTKSVIRSSHGHSTPSLKATCKSVFPFAGNVDKWCKRN